MMMVVGIAATRIIIIILGIEGIGIRRNTFCTKDGTGTFETIIVAPIQRPTVRVVRYMLTLHHVFWDP